MNFGLENKVALICASSKGLGKAAAQVLSDEKATVVICARTKTELAKTASEIENLTKQAVSYYLCDLESENEIKNLVQKVVKEHGSIDILVHNAGGPAPGKFLDIKKENWNSSISLNLMSGTFLCREIIPLMQKKKWGRIIFITSVSVKEPLPNLLLSNVARLGITGFAKTLAMEHGKDGILVNVVCPGPTATERMTSLISKGAEIEKISEDAALKRWTEKIPLNRLGKPEELANLIAFLASEKASYITGTVIPVDGGFVKAL